MSYAREQNVLYCSVSILSTIIFSFSQIFSPPIFMGGDDMFSH